MKKLKIILTAVGCPGASTLIKNLKNNGEREIEIVGIDSEPEVIGRFWCDNFYKSPLSDSNEYISFLLDLCKREKPDVLFPQSSYDIYQIAVNRKKFEEIGVKVLASDPKEIEIANNKYKMYEALKGSVNLPEYYFPQNLDDFLKCAQKLGYPEKAICFKPHVSKGSRGFRFIDSKISRKDLLLKQKPDSKYISLEEFIEIFKDEKDFPELLVMEKVEGIEYDAMALCYNGQSLLTTVKTREKSRWGVITLGELVDKPEITGQVDKIISRIPLKYNISIQFIGNKLIEINPRTSTYIFQDDLNEPYLAIMLLLNEISAEEIKKMKTKIKYGRKMIRYMDQIFWDK